MVGKGAQSLQVLVERKSRFTKLKKNKDKTADVSSQAVISMLAPIPADLRKSITYDNSSENVKHQDVNIQFGMRSFFCEPFHSWEKGSVENRNGLIRRFIPKGADLSTIPDAHIQFIEDWLNDRPMKCLKFDTPAEVLNSFGVALSG